MYWQKRFDRENPDIELEEKIHEIHKCNKEQEEGSTHYAEI